MNGGGGGGNTSKTELLPDWAYTLPSGNKPVQTYIDRMLVEFNKTYVAYTGSTFALQGEAFQWTDSQGIHTISNTFETDGIKAKAARGRNGHPLLTKGETLLADIIKGLKLNANNKIDDFYLKRAEAIIQFFEEDTLPRLKHQYNNIGQFRSIAHQAMEAKAAEEVMAKLSDIGMEIYFGDYIAEKSNQQSAMGMTIPYGDQDAVNAELLINAGEIQREYAQGKLIDDYNKYMELRTGLLRQLDKAGNALGTLMGMTKSEVTSFYRPSDAAQIAGLAMVGLGIYGQVKGQKQIGTGDAPYLKTDSPYTASQQDYLGGTSSR